jgi:hypothetical protein
VKDIPYALVEDRSRRCGAHPNIGMEVSSLGGFFFLLEHLAEFWKSVCFSNLTITSYEITMLSCRPAGYNSSDVQDVRCMNCEFEFLCTISVPLDICKCCSSKAEPTVAISSPVLLLSIASTFHAHPHPPSPSLHLRSHCLTHTDTAICSSSALA